MRGKALTFEGSGTRRQMLDLERTLTGVDPGLLSREPWAGLRLEDLLP